MERKQWKERNVMNERRTEIERKKEKMCRVENPIKPGEEKNHMTFIFPAVFTKK